MDFKINRGRGKCSVSGRAFKEGEEYVVALKADPDPDNEGVFERLEISLDAWESQARDDVTAWWRTEFTSKRKPALYDPDALWEVFHKARRKDDEGAPRPEEPGDEEASGGADSFSREELDRFAYVAALGLMRLKKLKLKGSRRQDGVSFMVFETPGRKGSRDTYEVIDLELDESGVDQIQDRLADLL